jgi:hypothetical protein
MRLPTYRDLVRYLQVEGWEDSDKASGKKTGDHHRYVFTTPTGERLFTKVSHGRGQIHDRGLFEHILREQLCIDEDQFWAAIDRGVQPTRPSPTPANPEGALEAKLVRNLLTKVKVTPDQLVGMTREEAIKRWQEWLSTNF